MKCVKIHGAGNYSIPEVMNKILVTKSMGRKANLFSFTIVILKLLGSISSTKKEIYSLVGLLCINNIYSKETLN
jgi:hypothetical protein